MGHISASIELISGVDLIDAKRHLIGEEEVKKIRVSMLVDTGSMEMCINENIQEYLQLPFMQKRRWRLANEDAVELDMVGPIEVRFENRRCTIDAVVLPGDSEPLFGAFPMEAMDVLVHPLRQELIINPKYPEGDMRRIPTLKPAGPTLYLDGSGRTYVYVGQPRIDGDSFVP